MSERNISAALKNSLKTNEPFIYYHLIKFEKPKPSGWSGATSGIATDYTYISDSPYNIDWDDLASDSQGNLLGTQSYVANKVLNVGGVQETTEARVSNMSIKLSSTALGTSASVFAQTFSNYIDAEVDFVDLGFREGDKILIEQTPFLGKWEDIDYSEGDVVTHESVSYVCISDITSGNSGTTTPTDPSGWWNFSNHGKNIRIDQFGMSTTVLMAGVDIFRAIDNSRIYFTPIDTGMALDTDNYSYSLNNVSEEINALTYSKTSTTYTNYINRDVYIYRVHSNPETGEIIGTYPTAYVGSTIYSIGNFVASGSSIYECVQATSGINDTTEDPGVPSYWSYWGEGDTSTLVEGPILVFKGIVAKGSVQETPDRASTITWSISSHWGDFVRLQGRVTADDSHRALSLTGRPDEDALLRPEYKTDYGFMHADKSINMLGSYQSQELRYKNKKRGGIAGWFGGTKLKEYYETVDKDVDLRFNLSAKYLPVVYGVQKVSSIPVFADLSEEAVTISSPQKLYVMYALCEGEIGGIYDIHVEENSSVCFGEEDSDARDPSGTAGNDDVNVEVYCYGRADRGDVLAGDPYVDHNIPVPIPFLNVDDRFYRFSAKGANFNTRLYNPRWDIIADNAPAETGLIHESSFSFSIPIYANFAVHTGKPDQAADNNFVLRAANTVNGTGFKIQKDYYEGDPLNYWSSSHQMLDTAYVSCEFTLTEEDSSIPQYEFVVKGKYVECYNYDFSYTQDLVSAASSVGEESDFVLGESVDIELWDGSGWETKYTNATIIDKWYIFRKDGTKDYRFRVALDALPSPENTNISLTLNNNNIATKLRFSRGNGFGGYLYWHMLTADYAREEGNITFASPIVEVTSVTYDDSIEAEEGSLTITLAGSELDSILEVSEGIATLAFNSAPDYHLLVESYNTLDNIVTLTPYSGAGYIAGSQNAGSSVFVSNLITTEYVGSVVGEKIEVTRFTAGIPDIRTKEILAVSGNYIFTTQPFTSGLIPSMNELTWGSQVIKDKYASGPASDERVSTNPAMQTLDYLTNYRYGKGLSIYKDINLDTFKLSAILCDDRSKVTLVCKNQPSVGNTYYYYGDYGNTLKFQGTVESVTERSYKGNTYYEVVFKHVIGKIGRKWNDWEVFQAGEIVWGFNRVVQVSSPGVIPEEGTDSISSNKDISSVDDPPGYLDFALINAGGAADLTVTLERLGGLKNTNNIVRSWNSDEQAFSNPGYSLHDSDDVLYWKYLGWEDKQQRWVTRHQTNQVINTNTPIFDNINSMLKQFNGMLRYSNGKYELDVKIGAASLEEPYWEEGITLLSEDDIIGDIKLSDKGQKESYNSIAANIVDPQNKYSARSISFFNSDYLKEDKGIPKKGNYSMPGITNYYTARTNIIQYLDESRYGLTITFTMAPTGYLLLAGKVIALSYDRFNWFNKKFRIESLTLQTNGLVAIVAREHNDDAYKIEFADRSAMDLDRATTPTSPNTLAPPTELAATGSNGINPLSGKIVLTWTNAPTYDISKSNQKIEIWAVEDTKTLGEYDFEPPIDNSTSSLIDVADGSSYTHEITSTEPLSVYYYWIRYVLYKDGKPGGYSKFEPLKSTFGIEGQANAPSTEAGLTILLSPTSVLLEADSFAVVPNGAYGPTVSEVTVRRGATALTATLGTPGPDQFSVTRAVSTSYFGTPPTTIGDITAPNATTVSGTDFVFPVMSSMKDSAPSATVTYTINVEGSFTHVIPQFINKVVEGKDAWQISGTNYTHVFIADAEGFVEFNDFSNLPTLVRLGIPYAYNNDGPAYPDSTFRYGDITTSAGAILNIPGNVSGTGVITIDGASTILDAGGPSSATISVKILNNADNQLLGFANILLTKSYSGIRGGKEFILTAGDIETGDVSLWFTDPEIPNTVDGDNLAKGVVNAVIALPENDGWIRPNDRITISDTSTSNAGTRIFDRLSGVDINNVGSVGSTDFSSLVVEIFPGSVIVDGTLSADKLVANALYSNNARIASNLVIGDSSAIYKVKSGLAPVGGSSGIGYLVGDILTFVGGSPIGDAASVRVISIGGSGEVTGVILANSGGYPTNISSPISVTGGSGTSASITFQTSNLWGQLYSKGKTSWGDPSSGFFANADGYFDVGDGSSYLRYDPDSGQITMKGNVVVQNSNTQLVTWEAGGTASLDASNFQVSSTTGNGWVKSNTALGIGVNATCQPANLDIQFKFGLSNTPDDLVYNGTDIDYGWTVNSGTTEATTFGAATNASTTIGTDSLLQVMCDDDTIRWFNGTVEVASTSNLEGFVYSWKGSFPLASTQHTTSIGISLGVAATDGTDGADGADGAQGPSGDEGIQGPAGADGIDNYFHVAYSTASPPAVIGDFSQTPGSGYDYIGTYVDGNVADAAWNSGLWNWALYVGGDGSQGIPGVDGVDGVTYYLHLAWADDASGTGFDTADPTGHDYIGTYTDTTAADAAAGSGLWNWALYVGTDGSDGSDGPRGYRGYRGFDGDDGVWGSAWYTITAGTTNSYEIDANAINNAIGRNYPLEGDVCVVRSGTAANAYTYNGTTWTTVPAFIDGNMVVEGSISATELAVFSNSGADSMRLGDTKNSIDIFDGSNLRVRLGEL